LIQLLGTLPGAHGKYPLIQSVATVTLPVVVSGAVHEFYPKVHNVGTLPTK